MAILLPTERNIKIYAVENYTNKACLDEEEFWEDFSKIKYVKRLLGRYVKDGELKERLILNHLISFYNVFTIEAANRMLFLKVNDDCKSALKTFLIYLNYLPQNWYTNVPLDKRIVNILREL
jgi:hypothetical protein|tara:strand:+ start:163 stop:528 length:366 start_codon:yes stop_codon:yes gene_type:complete